MMFVHWMRLCCFLTSNKPGAMTNVPRRRRAETAMCRNNSLHGLLHALSPEEENNGYGNKRNGFPYRKRQS
jgi:hypothetical protein